MRRLLYLFLVICTALCFFSCEKAEEANFVCKGIYTVQLVDSEICFRAVLDEEYQEYVFTEPEAIAGLKAVSYDGVDFELDYKGIKQNVYSFALKSATDFSAATELLQKAGVKNGDRVSAFVDGLSAEGITKNGKLTELSFTDGRNKRNYIIVTEATG